MTQPTDLVRFYDASMRDAQVCALSAYGRFWAACDAMCACGLLRFPSLIRAEPQEPEALMQVLGQHPEMEPMLAASVRLLARRAPLFRSGETLATNAWADRAYRCALAMHAAILARDPSLVASTAELPADAPSPWPRRCPG